MKRFIGFLLCFIGFAQAQILTDDQKEKIVQYSKECMAETKVDKDLVMAAANGNYANDDKLKQQILCFNKKVKFQKENGDIDMAVVKDRLMDLAKDEKKVDEIIKKCIVKKDTPENTAFEAVKCLHEYAPGLKIQLGA